MHTHMLAIKHGIGTARQDRWKDSSEQGRRWKLKSQCQEEQLELREYHINISSHFNQKIYLLWFSVFCLCSSPDTWFLFAVSLGFVIYWFASPDSLLGHYRSLLCPVSVSVLLNPVSL